MRSIRKAALFFLILGNLFLLNPAWGGDMRLHLNDTLEEDIKQFRRAVGENILDEDAYFTIVLAMEWKGVFDGDVKAFLALKDDLARPGEILVNHRLENALRVRGHNEAADFVKPQTVIKYIED